MTSVSDRSRVFRKRQDSCRRLLSGHCVLLFAGAAPPRNYRANTYPFRANSHFLYLTGLSLPNAILGFDDEAAVLFIPELDVNDAIWHGESPSFEALKAAAGVDGILPLSKVELWVNGRPAMTIAANDAETASVQSRVLQRTIRACSADALDVDAPLADVLIHLRLQHDEDSLSEIRKAITVSGRVHFAGAMAARPGVYEYSVRAAIEHEMHLERMVPAYSSIVTRRGDVLHNHDDSGRLAAGDLLLVDAGAETINGWASDITRVWPIGGKFSSSQKAIYEVVFQANRAAIRAMKPGVFYRDVHVCAALTMIEGLLDLKILRGSVDECWEKNAGAIFFPHGVGHLLGLDVHDMEDLGDRAGYAPGLSRSSRFGEAYLRCNRELQSGMILTIEPGFYTIEALLTRTRQNQELSSCVDWERLALFADVRGIRLEDDVLVTPTGCEILSAEIPILADEIERIMNGAKRLF